MTAAIDLATVLAHTTWTTPAPTAGEQPKPTTDNPMPSKPGPRHTSLLDRDDRVNADRLGRLDFLVSEMAHAARVDGCPPALADLITQARAVLTAGAVS